MQKLISVIVPIYKVEKYLNKCIDSIISQTYKNLEIILVDDGSPDGCGKICDDYAEKDSRIKVVHKENGGLSDARNAGIAVATGEYISFVDSDDWIGCNMLHDLYNTMLADNSDIASCGVRWVTESGIELRNDIIPDNQVLNTLEAMRELLNDRKLKDHVWNKLYKRDLIQKILFKKGKYHEDVFWSYQVVAKAHRVSVVSNTYYYYVQRSSSIMGAEYSEKRLDALDANAERCIFIKEHFPDLYNKALYVYLGNCMYQLQYALSANCDKTVISNIIDRLSLKFTGNPHKEVSGKQKIWFTLFLKFPLFTCKIRNKLGIGK